MLLLLSFVRADLFPADGTKVEHALKTKDITKRARPFISLLKKPIKLNGYKTEPHNEITCKE